MADLRGKSFLDFVPDQYKDAARQVIVERREKIKEIEDGTRKQFSQSIELPFINKSNKRIEIQASGRAFIADFKVQTIRIHKGPPIKKNHIYTIGIARDITDKKRLDEQIKTSLKEKEILLQEIHHRVKNNMQVINSLLKLQANTIDDDQIKQILNDSQSRLYAMSAVHESLHGSENLSNIDFKTYLSKVTASIFQTYSVTSDKVKLNTSIDEIPISINQVSPLGLIINELISNSLKYAFPEEKTGKITVRMKKLDNELELVVMDDGVGIPAELDWKNISSLGLKLVRTLVENQLDGIIEMERKKGTKFVIKFNLES